MSEVYRSSLAVRALSRRWLRASPYDIRLRATSRNLCHNRSARRSGSCRVQLGGARAARGVRTAPRRRDGRRCKPAGQGAPRRCGAAAGDGWGAAARRARRRTHHVATGAAGNRPAGSLQRREPRRVLLCAWHDAEQHLAGVFGRRHVVRTQHTSPSALRLRLRLARSRLHDPPAHGMRP